MNSDASGLLRVLVAAVAARVFFHVCRRGFLQATTPREQQFWTIAAIVSITGVLALLFTTSVPAVVGSRP